jgi:hypothetical protein
MLFNALLLAFREIRRNVLRSSLTALGIIIGVASVIIMVTLGNGATEQVRSDIASMGSNLLTVRPGQRVGPGGASSASKPFRRQDIDALSRDVDSVTSIAPVATMNLSVISGAKNRSTNVTGTTNAYFESGGWKLTSGRWFSESELRSGARFDRSDRQPAPVAFALMQCHRPARIERQEPIRAGSRRYRGHSAADDAAQAERKRRRRSGAALGQQQRVHGKSAAGYHPPAARAAASGA